MTIDMTTERILGALLVSAGADLATGRTIDGVRKLRRAAILAPRSIAPMRELARWCFDRAQDARCPRPEPVGPSAWRRSVSVVICSPDAPRSAPAVAHWHSMLEGLPHEVVPVIGPRSLAAGLNDGLAAATGDAVILSHDDVRLLSRGAALRLLGDLEQADIVGVAGTDRLCSPSWVSSGWPHLFGQVIHAMTGGYSVSVYRPSRAMAPGMVALDGLLIAARRDVARAIGFDATRFDGFHLYDLDFTWRAARAGFSLAVAGDVPVLHASTGNYGADWSRYADRFLDLHGDSLSAPIQRTDTYVQADFENLDHATRFCRALSRLYPAPQRQGGRDHLAAGGHGGNLHASEVSDVPEKQVQP